MSDPVSRLNATLSGRYRVERELGEGGMATVYLAADLRHERKVALKVLKPELAAVVGAERFLSEIKTTANLQHPHILPLFDSGEAEGYLYYVMPYIEGETLREKLDREKQLGVEESVRIARDVADALDYAHRHGVIHRDIKPGNVLLHDGRPVVADFGIALAVSAAGGGRMTETGLSLGTPHYMSPEQASADRDLSPRSDIYSLGCVLYEMLAGQPPHTGPSARSILVHILTEEPKPLPSLRHTVPPNVAATVAKSIEKLPADRFESGKQFMDALSDSAFAYQTKVSTAALGHPAAATRARSGGRVPVRAAAVLGAALVASWALAAWALLRPEPLPPVSRQTLATDGWRGFRTSIGDAVALAPDGSSMVLPVYGGGVGVYQLGLKMRGAAEVVPIPGTEASERSVPVYSPDGGWIAYATGRELHKRPLVGGASVTLAEDVASGIPGLAWLDDGTIIYDQEAAGQAGTARLARISEDGGEPLGVVLELAEIYRVEGLPGGRGALVVGCSTPACGLDANNVYLVDLQSGESELLFERAMGAWYIPSGHLVYVRFDGAVLAVPFDLATLTVGDSGVPLFEGVRRSGNVMDMALGADGTLLYVAGSAGQSDDPRVTRLVVSDLAGRMEPLGLSPRPIGTAAWSPDGSSIVYSSGGQIYTYDVVLQTVPRQLTFSGTNNRALFSPGGGSVVFASIRDGTLGTDLFVKDVRSDGPPRQLVRLPGDQLPAQWPSDSLIVFEHLLDGSEVWTLDLARPDSAVAAPYLQLEASAANPAVSPDGTLAAYVTRSPGLTEIQLRRFPQGGEPTVVWRSESVGANTPTWSPDGRTLYFNRQLRQGINFGVMFAARLRRDATPVVLSLDSLTAPVQGTPFGFPGQASLHPDGDRWIRRELPETSDDDDGTEAPDRLILVENWFTELRVSLGDN